MAGGRNPRSTWGTAGGGGGRAAPPSADPHSWSGPANSSNTTSVEVPAGLRATAIDAGA